MGREREGGGGGGGSFKESRCNHFEQQDHLIPGGLVPLRESHIQEPDEEVPQEALAGFGGNGEPEAVDWHGLV